VKLVEDARKAWRWFSVQAMALALAIQGAWEVLPAEMKSSIPSQYVTYATLVLLGLGLVGRLVKQK
jgi:protein-S-isoprenylcysteine O-methyltransferase Ste14